MPVLASNPFYAFINSELPTLVLLTAICLAFERAFNLTHYRLQSGQGYYLLDETQHAHLTSLDASVTFLLSASLSTGPCTNITLPYAAFDLQLMPPLGLVGGQRYFSLQQATSDTQYVLGHTFLTHAYVIADYNRGNFSVGPALFPENASRNIVAIYPPSPPKRLSKGAQAGIALGVIAAVAPLLVFAAVGARRFWKEKRKQKGPGPQEQYEKPELGGVAVEVAELGGVARERLELHEDAAERPPAAELHGYGTPGQAQPMSELEARAVLNAVELPI